MGKGDNTGTSLGGHFFDAHIMHILSIVQSVDHGLLMSLFLCARCAYEHNGTAPMHPSRRSVEQQQTTVTTTYFEVALIHCRSFAQVGPRKESVREIQTSC